MTALEELQEEVFEVTNKPRYSTKYARKKSGIEKEHEKLESYKHDALSCAKEYSRRMPDFKERIKAALTVGEVERIVKTARNLL